VDNFRSLGDSGMLDSVLHSLSNNCGVDTDVAGGVQDHLLLFCFVDVALTLE